MANFESHPIEMGEKKTDHIVNILSHCDTSLSP